MLDFFKKKKANKEAAEMASRRPIRVIPDSLTKSTKGLVSWAKKNPKMAIAAGVGTAGLATGALILANKKRKQYAEVENSKPKRKVYLGESVNKGWYRANVIGGTPAIIGMRAGKRAAEKAADEGRNEIEVRNSARKTAQKVGGSIGAGAGALVGSGIGYYLKRGPKKARAIAGAVGALGGAGISGGLGAWGAASGVKENIDHRLKK